MQLDADAFFGGCLGRCPVRLPFMSCCSYLLLLLQLHNSEVNLVVLLSLTCNSVLKSLAASFGCVIHQLLLRCCSQPRLLLHLPKTRRNHCHHPGCSRCSIIKHRMHRTQLEAT